MAAPYAMSLAPWRIEHLYWASLSLAWVLNRLFGASDEAPSDQVVVAIGNPALRQTWQQVLE